MSFLSLPGMMKKGHFKSSLRHSWIEWSRNGCIIFENVFVFLPLTTHFYGKIVQKIQHSMRVSTFHRSIYAPNGTFSQPESTTGARRDCDACNCFDARTLSDARGSRGARGKDAVSPHVPTPASHSLAPWSPWGATTVPKFFCLGIFELSTVIESTNSW